VEFQKGKLLLALVGLPGKPLPLLLANLYITPLPPLLFPTEEELIG